MYDSAFQIFDQSVKKRFGAATRKKAQAKNIIDQSISVDFNREATVRCKYIQGVEQLFSNQECQIAANENECNDPRV